MFYLLQKQIDSDVADTGNVWIANLITGAVIIGVIGFLIIWMINKITADINSAKNEARSASLKAEQVERTVQSEVRKIVDSENEYRVTQSRWMGTIEGKIDRVNDRFEDIDERVGHRFDDLEKQIDKIRSRGRDDHR